MSGKCASFLQSPLTRVRSSRSLMRFDFETSPSLSRFYWLSLLCWHLKQNEAQSASVFKKQRELIALNQLMSYEQQLWSPWPRKGLVCSSLTLSTSSFHTCYNKYSLCLQLYCPLSPMLTHFSRSHTVLTFHSRPYAFVWFRWSQVGVGVGGTRAGPCCYAPSPPPPDR